MKAQHAATRMLVVKSSGCDYVCARVALSVAVVPGRPKAVCLIDSVGFKCHSQQSLGNPRDHSKLEATKEGENDIGVPRKQLFSLLLQRQWAENKGIFCTA